MNDPTLSHTALSRISADDRSFLFFNAMPDGSLLFGDCSGRSTLGHSMFGEQGMVVTAVELNWWALMHDGVIDYDEFLLWKIEHPGEDYSGKASLDDVLNGTRHYMQGGTSRQFLGAKDGAA